jgi:uncharacterized protein (TIGR03089 family)
VSDEPLDVTRLLAALRADDPGRPRLTWYGPDGERVELSASVLSNWVAKTANLLVDELDAGPGSRVGLALPAHWRTVVWLLGTWSAGACAVIGDAGVDVLVTHRPEAGAAPVVVGVALPALAASFGAGLPAGAIDGASEVRAQGDTFAPPGRPAGNDPGFEAGDGVLDYAQLRTAATRGFAGGVRLLTGAGPQQAVAAWLAPLQAGGSIVLHHALDALPAPELERLAAQEGVTG